LDVRAGTLALGAELLSKIRAASFARVRARSALTSAAALPQAPVVAKGQAPKAPLRSSNKVVAIGASTGGTEALLVVLRALPADAPAVLIVQHMPARFTGPFAERLNRDCKMHVKEARDGDLVRAGSVLLAPGDFHMRLARNGASFIVRLTRDAAIGQHRPAVDALFSSCAREAATACVAVLLTGMGSDGAAGMLELRQAGATTIAQDEQTSVVFGMPREAIARGAVLQVLPLERISAALMKAAAA
jgi:two-component system chemotaxis response regulator CheB